MKANPEVQWSAHAGSDGNFTYVGKSDFGDFTITSSKAGVTIKDDFGGESLANTSLEAMVSVELAVARAAANEKRVLEGLSTEEPIGLFNTHFEIQNEEDIHGS